MNSKELQASGVSAGVNTGLRCIASTQGGHVCGRPATVFDPQRSGMVCVVHSPKPRFEVTRSYLGKAEELLITAAEHARKEASTSSVEGIERVKILSLAVAARRLRSELEGGV
jgi:hypothetical protein